MLFLNLLCRHNSALSKHKFLLSTFKMSQTTERVCSTSKKSKLNVKSEQDKAEDFKPFFRFPYINFMASINKLKVYQSIFTVFGIPLCIVLEKIEMIPDDTTFAFTAIGISGIGTLSLFSLFTQNIIGIMYYNEKEDSVRISHLDFVGRRKNQVYNRKDFVPFSELPGSKKYYTKVQLYDVDKVNYKLFYKMGGIMDPEIFSKVFGEE